MNNKEAAKNSGPGSFYTIIKYISIGTGIIGIGLLIASVGFLLTR